ncbi:NUDIX domain-containing protein [Corynebacterium sp. CCM 8862]|uniref:NUDIX domain-containing protein n=1 Tax=Corynebacterium mendelii TaxID=2765362 RepID=A0A939E351_9CORY|nr:NUDIX domain-containing protein [Corynebacterium mendelii]MBN9644821.1 NUDIX domain-containing protein [Corynebacterium mendelii]
MPDTIEVAAVVALDARGRILSVRKTHTGYFLLPGGKPEPGEKPRDTAARELAEETGITARAGDLSYSGRFSAPAANEPGCTVECELFVLSRPIDGDEVAVDREIAEARFFRPDSTDPVLAPLSREVIFPALAATAPGPSAAVPQPVGNQRVTVDTSPPEPAPGR